MKVSLLKLMPFLSQLTFLMIGASAFAGPGDAQGGGGTLFRDKDGKFVVRDFSKETTSATAFEPIDPVGGRPEIALTLDKVEVSFDEIAKFTRAIFSSWPANLSVLSGGKAAFDYYRGLWIEDWIFTEEAKNLGLTPSEQVVSDAYNILVKTKQVRQLSPEKNVYIRQHLIGQMSMNLVIGSNVRISEPSTPTREQLEALLTSSRPTVKFSVISYLTPAGWGHFNERDLKHERELKHREALQDWNEIRTMAITFENALQRHLKRTQEQLPLVSTSEQISGGRFQIVPSVYHALIQLEPGSVSDVVESSFGFHILKLHDKLTSQTPTPAEIEVLTRYWVDQEKARLADEFQDAATVVKARVISKYRDRIRVR